jgi:hypothetical protein
MMNPIARKVCAKVLPQVQRAAAKRVMPAGPTPARSPARYVGAIVVAAASDVLSAGFAFIPPAELAIDLVTALAIWQLMGWRRAMLIPLIAEAIPGVAVFPSWFLVVLALGAFPRPAETATPAVPNPSTDAAAFPPRPPAGG